MDEKIYRYMLEKGLISDSSWLRRAIEQKHPRLSVDLAYSEPVFFDPLDAVLGTQSEYGESVISEN